VKTGIFVFLKMQHISGISRHQMRISSLEDAISADNQVLITVNLYPKVMYNI
jgi:hypothetical protein